LLSFLGCFPSLFIGKKKRNLAVCLSCCVPQQQQIIIMTTRNPSRKRYADAAMLPSQSVSHSINDDDDMDDWRRRPAMSHTNKRSRTYATNARERVSQGTGMSLHVLSDIEALEALGLETDSLQLREALADTQKAMKELIAMNNDSQADLDARASGEF
jgi:hypothetical protein